MNWNRNSRSYNLNEAFVLDETHHEDNKETIKKRRRSDSLSSVEDDEPVVHPRGLPTRAHSIDFGLDEVDKRKPCRDCLLGCFVVFFVLALMTCVAIILYFVLINTVFAGRETKTLTGALTVEGSLLLNETYHSDLADPQSMAYREMENEFLSSMNASFSSSSLADIYAGAQVQRFEQGSVRIVFAIFLLSGPNDADTEAEVIFEVQVTIGDGISSGFFDEFDVIGDSLEITAVNQESRTIIDSSTTVSTEALEEQSTTTTVLSVTTQIISAVSTLLSTPVTTTADTVYSTNEPSTTRQLSTHLPISPTVALTSPSTTVQSTTSSTFSPTRTETTTAATVNSTNKPSTTGQLSTDLPTSPTVALTGPTTTTQSTSSTFSPTTSSTTVDNATGSFHFTVIPTTTPPSPTDSPTTDTTYNTTPSITRVISPTATTIQSSSSIPLSSTYLSKTGTTLTTIPSTREKLSTTSSTTVDNATGSFHFTVSPTTTPPSPTESPTTDTTYNTTPSITRVISPTAAETTSTPTTITASVVMINDLTTTRPPPFDPPTSTTTPTDSTTAGISSPSATSPPSTTAEMNITRQLKIHSALPDICGIRPALDGSDDGTARIVGGTQSAAGTWPWMGSLRQGGSHQCGAVLIHPEWAITAHHCIGFFDNIVLGDTDLYGNTNTSPYRVQRNVQTFSNPDFNPVTDEGDIALVRLTEPVEFNDHVQPLCINTLMTEMRSFDNCFVTGWGTDDFDHQVAMRYLQEASIQMFDRSNCREWYQSYHTITNQHICAGEEDGRRDACSGDSGGPLQCQDDQGIWYLLGVVSFGQDCGLPRLPGVYTRISTQISFLSQILATNIK